MQIAWPAGVCLAGLLLVVIDRFRRPRDPVLGAWAAFGLVGCLLMLPLLVARHQQESHDAALREEVASLREAARTRLRQIEQERLDAIEQQIPEGTSDRFARYRGKIDALTLGELRLLDSRMQQDVKARAEAYRKALEENPTAGPNSWLTFRTIGELERERTAHQTLYAATRAFTDFIERFEETYTQAIADEALKPPADRIAIAEMTRILQSWERSNIYEIRRLDVQVLAAALNALNILHDQWGNWSYSPREEQIRFDDAASERAFLEAIQRLQAASKEARALTQDGEKNEG